MPEINILVALSCEAKPLIDYFRLKKVVDKPFSQYLGCQDDLTISLVVSGSGVINMAAATGWWGAQADDSSVWLNIGTAGHRELSVGEICLVHCVEHSVGNNAGRVSYPPLIAKWRGETIAIKTVAEPCVNYPPEVAVDMEASAFFSIAQKFTDAELVQSLKVISDNTQSGIEQLNAKRITELIATNLPMITTFINSFVRVTASQTEYKIDISESEHLHCTVTQQHQFIEAMRCARALKLEALPECSNYQSMASLLKQLQARLDAVQPKIT